MSNQFQNLPTFQESLDAIERLKNIDWPLFKNFDKVDDYINDIEQIIFREFKIIPEGLRLIPTSKFEIPIFRARPLNSIKNINLIEEHSYPPIEHTTFQRCNFPENPVFYCSNNPMTTLVEINRNYDLRGKEFCLTKWEVKPSEKEICTQNFFHSSSNKKNPLFDIREYDIKHLENNLQFKTENDFDKKRGLLELFKFIHQTFISDNKYEISAAIAHRALYAEHNYKSDIIIYPSVQTKFRGINMAISPNFVDIHMKLKRLYIVKVDNIDKINDLLNVSFGGFGEVINNSIEWISIADNEEYFLKNRSIDFQGIIKN